MQISRTQNQPNFRAKVKIQNQGGISHHLPKELKPLVYRSFAELKKIGDDSVEFTTFFNPRHHKPFGLMCKVPGLDIPIFHKSIEAQELPIMGTFAMQDAKKEAANPVLHTMRDLGIEDWMDEIKPHLTALFSPKHKDPYAVICTLPKLDMPIMHKNLHADEVPLIGPTAYLQAQEELRKTIVHPQRNIKLEEWARDRGNFLRIEA